MADYTITPVTTARIDHVHCMTTETLLPKGSAEGLQKKHLMQFGIIWESNVSLGLHKSVYPCSQSP